jgi:hypothetical protein
VSFRITFQAHLSLSAFQSCSYISNSISLIFIWY